MVFELCVEISVLLSFFDVGLFDYWKVATVTFDFCVFTSYVNECPASWKNTSLSLRAIRLSVILVCFASTAITL